MHQHTVVRNIIGMIILDLEVIDLDRAFEQLMLDLFDNDIFAIDEDENVTGAEVRRVRPALGGTVERMRRRSNDLLAVNENVCQLGRFVDIGLNDLLERNIVRFLVPCPDEVADFDLLDRNAPVFGNDRRPGYEAIRNRIDMPFQRTGGCADRGIDKRRFLTL